MGDGRVLLAEIRIERRHDRRRDQEDRHGNPPRHSAAPACADVDEVLLGVFDTLPLFGTQGFSVPSGILVDRGVRGREKLGEFPAGRLDVVFVADPDPAAIGFRIERDGDSLRQEIIREPLGGTFVRNRSKLPHRVRFLTGPGQY